MTNTAQFTLKKLPFPRFGLSFPKGICFCLSFFARETLSSFAQLRICFSHPRPEAPETLA